MKYKKQTLFLLLFFLVIPCVHARGGGGGMAGMAGMHGGREMDLQSRFGDFADRTDFAGRFNNFPAKDNLGSSAERANVNTLLNPAMSGPYITRGVSAADMASQGDAVRRNYAYPGIYNKAFWAAHPEAGWAYANRWADDWAWNNTTWPTLAYWWGLPIATVPIAYDFGNNITYQNDTVYYGSQPEESTVAYYGQAQSLADSIPIAADEDRKKNNWKPLGVFSMVQGDQKNTTDMFQLAVNKKGAIKGTYYNPVTGETKPVYGAIDKKNMRASWTIGGNKDIVYDSGLRNLLGTESQILVHYNKDKTEQHTLVRLQLPGAS